MEKDGKIIRPGGSRQSSFTRSPSNSSIDAIYPPQLRQPKAIGDDTLDDAKKVVADEVDVPKIFGLPLKYVS